MLGADQELALKRLAEVIRAAFGSDLVSLVLYGSAAGDDFVAGRSDFNYAIVVERITHAHLKLLHEHLPSWRKLGMAMPLLLDRAFLRRARDVFPMELHDIQAQHRVLFGEEVIANLTIDSRHLRYQAEHEARSKLMRLRALYVEVGSDDQRFKGLLLESVKTFVILMRNLVRLRASAAHPHYATALAEFERCFDTPFPTMRRLLRLRAGNESWPDEIDALFDAYLGEVERLVDLIDQSLPDSGERA